MFLATNNMHVQELASGARLQRTVHGTFVMKPEHEATNSTRDSI